MIKTELPFSPLSFNNAYAGKGRRFLTPEAKAYKKTIALMCKDYKLDFDSKTEAIAVDYTFYLAKITKKDGGLMARRHDYDGFIKLFQDSLFDCLGIDDSFITDAVIRKREGTPKIIAKIWTIPLDQHLISQ